MKPTNDTRTSYPHVGRSRGNDAKAVRSYDTTKEMRAALAGSLAARRERLSRGDMVSTDEAASIADTSRVTINAWITQGKCIGLTQTKRGFKLPRWQFEPMVFDVLLDLSKALDTTDGWTLLAFLETPHGALGGITPRAAIEQGNSHRVVDIAGQEGN